MRRVLFMALVAGCSSPGQTCPGAGSAPTNGATATIGAESFTYGGFRWGANNDCPAAGSSVISVTITGTQVTPPGAGFGIGLCLPRPDLLDDNPVPLGDTTRVQLVSVGAASADGQCATRLDRTVAPTGTITFTGFCTQSGMSYAMSFAGQVGGTRTCLMDAGPTTMVPVTVQLGGLVAVTPR